MLTWTGVLGSDVTVPSGQAITLQITTAQSAVSFKISFNSMTKPSRISLLPVSTFVDITSFSIYDAAYPAGNVISSSISNTNVYAGGSYQSVRYRILLGWILYYLPGYIRTTSCRFISLQQNIPVYGTPGCYWLI
jgi:hypothetical protein